MSQNITLLGVDYPTVPAVDLPKTGGGTARFYDLPALWLPPSAQLVASATDSTNLKNDTSWDNWSPSTTNTSIADAGTARAACSYTITGEDIQNKAIIGACMYITEYAYKSGTSIAKGYSKNKVIYGVGLYAPIKLLDYPTEDYGTYIAGTHGKHIYYTSASATSVYTSTSYGVSPTSITFTTSSATNASSRTVGFTRPAIYARCSSSYFSTACAGKIDSANTNIIGKYKLWLVDKEECMFYSLFDNTNGLFFV